MKINFLSASTGESDAYVVGIAQDLNYLKEAREVDLKTNGSLKKAIENSYFTGKQGETLIIPNPMNVPAKRLVVLGLGDLNSLNEYKLNTLGGKITAALAITPDSSVEVHLADLDVPNMTGAEALAQVALGANLRSWRFDKYRTQEKDEQKPKLDEIRFIASFAEQAKQIYNDYDQVAEGVFLTRELVSEPANVIYPETLAAKAKELKSLGLKVEVLGEKKMKALGMNSLLGVGAGSAKESQLVILQWNGAGKSEAPVAFVGKGVTFDTGGISIKPSGGMEEMKWDMGGSGVVLGLMKALAARKAKVNAVGVVGLVENMPDGNAQRPGDVVTSMSGQTIEILNTDAEGRLVLADALWYTQDRFKPKAMIDLATLTMAIIIALGHEYAGLFSNNDELANRLMSSGEKVDEKLCRFPLHPNYDNDINSDIADVRNTQKTARAAGSITAAHFLERFVNKVPWAHLDIAGTAWSNKDLPCSEKGATGYGVRLLDRFIRDHYEAA